MRRQRAARRCALAVALGSLAGFLACATLPAQEAPHDSAPQSAPAELTASDVLARAIAAQGLPPVADPAADLPLALHAKVNLQYKSPQGDVLSINVERKFLGQKDGPGLIWTRSTSTSDKKKSAISGFDGKRPWVWSSEAGVRWLDQPGGEKDRAELEHDLEETGLLTRAALLRNLPRELRDLKRLPDETGYGMTAWVIEGIASVVRDGKKKPVTLRLYFDQKTVWLMGARVTIADEAPQQICFTKHEKTNGVVTPGKIEIYAADEKSPRETFYVTSLEFAPKLIAADFEPPAK